MAFTLDERTPRIQYTVSSSQDTFTFPFEFFDNDDIDVITDDGTTVTTMTDEGGFTVTGVPSDDGIAFENGSILLDTAVTTGTVTILRNSKIDRLSQHPTSGPFDIDSLNTALSRLFAICQELRLQLDRTFRLKDEDPTEALEVPDVDDRKGKFLYFDPVTGEASVSDGTIGTGGATVSAAMTPVVEATTLANARTALGVPGLADANTYTSTNIFQALVTMESSTGGDVAEFKHSGAGNAANEVCTAYVLGDSTDTATDYGKICVSSPVITDTSEAGYMALSVMIAGTLTEAIGIDGQNSKVIMGLPIQHSAPGTSGQVLTSNGAGTPATFQAAPSGKVAQIVNSLITTGSTVSTALPVDDTLPQSTEGVQITTVDITPTASDSTLIIGWHANVAHATGGAHMSGALFQDATADAIDAATVEMSASGEIAQVAGIHTMTAGTTSTITFKLRVGPDTGSGYVNQTSAGANLFSTAGPKSGITVVEVLA